MLKTIIVAVAASSVICAAAGSARARQTPAAQTQAPPSTPAPSSPVDSEFGTALALIDHVQKILDDASRARTGSVTIDRGLVDEMRAELAQVRISLKGGVVRTDR
jgi:hypothetical protein